MPHTDRSIQFTSKLRQTLFLYLATALLAVVLALAVVLSQALFRHLKKVEDMNVSHAAELRAMAVSEWCRRAKDLAMQVTSRTQIRRELEKYNLGDISLEELRRFSEPKLRDAMNLSDDIVGILRLDARHQLAAVCGKGKNLPVSLWKDKNHNFETVKIMEPLTIGNSLVIVVGAPIVNPGGERQGTDLVMMDAAGLRHIVSNSKKKGRTSYTTIGYKTSTGIRQLFSEEYSSDAGTQAADRLDVIRSSLLKAIDGQSGFESKADILSAYAPISESAWGLVITQSKSALYSPVYREIIVIGVFFVVIYLITLFGFWLKMRPLAGRLLLHTDELEKRIQEKTVVLERQIAERRRAEEALQQLNDTLEKQVAERTALATARAQQLQSLAVELIEAEERERQRIAQLLHDDLQQLLASAKMQLNAACTEFPVNALLASVEKLLEESIAKSRGLSHELSPSVLHHSGLIAGLKWLAGQMYKQFGLQVEFESCLEDKYDMELKGFVFRAVQELLFNVVKHASVKQACVVLRCEGGRLVVSVSDKGCGFNPDNIDSPDPKAGFGLLSIRERASYVGGELIIESIPGKGSRFTLFVPTGVARTEPAAPDDSATEIVAPVTKHTAQTNGLRVLFADDHKVMRQGLIRLVNGQPDIQVVGEAANGRQALELARQLDPDVIVMDISMPVMDGIEATRRIKDEMPQVRVIGLSMMDDEHLTRAMREAGADAYLNKSVSPAELLRAIYNQQRIVL